MRRVAHVAELYRDLHNVVPARAPSGCERAGAVAHYGLRVLVCGDGAHATVYESEHDHSLEAAGDVDPRPRRRRARRRPRGGRHVRDGLPVAVGNDLVGVVAVRGPHVEDAKARWRTISIPDLVAAQPLGNGALVAVTAATDARGEAVTIALFTSDGARAVLAQRVPVAGVDLLALDVDGDRGGGRGRARPPGDEGVVRYLVTRDGRLVGRGRPWWW